MTPTNALSLDTLWSLVGTPAAPVVVDARTDDDFAADPRRIPGAVRRPPLAAADWAGEFAGRRVVT